MRMTGLCLATLLPLFSAPAMARTELPPRATVFVGDLDLGSQAGASALRRRIDRAVVAISGGDAPPLGSLIPSPDLDAARANGRRQADAMIAAARSAAAQCPPCNDNASGGSNG